MGFFAKYHNKITPCEGIRFHSKAEATRYQELRLLERAKEISSLELQPAFPLHSANGEAICKYIADFKYVNKDGLRVVEDKKGFKTPVYIIKKKWFLSEYPEYIFLET